MRIKDPNTVHCVPGPPASQEWSTLKCSGEEVAIQYINLWNSFLVLEMMKFLSLTCVLDAGGILHVGSVLFSPLWWWEAPPPFLPYDISSHLWYLHCLCSAIALPVKHQVMVFLDITPQSHPIFLNIIGQSYHILLNITGQSQHAPNQDPTGGANDGVENGDWKQQLGLQTTNSTYQHGINYITNMTITFSINTSSDWSVYYVCPTFC